MTVTSPDRPAAGPPKSRGTSRYAWWVPAAAGWTVGIIATLSLIASVSPFAPAVIRAPGDRVHGDESVIDDSGEVIGLAFHVATILFPMLARKQFWAKLRRGPLVEGA